MNSEINNHGLTTETIVNVIRELSLKRPSNDFKELKKIVENAEVSYICYLLVAASRKGIIRDVKYITSVAVLNNCWNEINDAFCEAAGAAHFDIVKFFVETGANIHYSNEKALRLAVKAGYGDIVTYLLEYGADVNILDGTLLVECCASGDYADIVEQLIYFGVDMINNYHEALNTCYKYGRKDCAQALIRWSSKHGCPPQAPPTPGAAEFEHVLNLRQSEEYNELYSSETDSNMSSEE